MVHSQGRLGLASGAFAHGGGMDSHNPEHPLTPAAYLGWVQRLKLEGLHLSTLRHFAAPLEVALPPLAAQARQQGLFLQLAVEPGHEAVLQPLLRQAAACQVRLVVVHLPSEVAGAQADAAPQELPDVLAVALESAGRDCHLAVAPSSDLPPSRLAQLLSAWDHPRLGAAYDPVTALLTGLNPVQAAAELAPRLLTAVVRDAVLLRPAGGDDEGTGAGPLRLRYTLPGEGDLEFWRVMNILRDQAERLRTVNVGSPLGTITLSGREAGAVGQRLAAHRSRRQRLEQGERRRGQAAAEPRRLQRAEEEAVREAVARIKGRYERPVPVDEAEHGAGQLPTVGRHLLSKEPDSPPGSGDDDPGHASST